MSIAVFEHVSEEQYREAMQGRTDCLPVEEIPLPARSTRGSAGYDFICPAETVVPAEGKAVIPTGIRCRMEEGWVLLILPRSGLGFRHQVRLSNTAGVIDSDYYYAENEGHIMVSLRNPLKEELRLGKGDRFCQGIFLPYGLAEEEDRPGERKGGFGSTGK